MMTVTISRACELSGLSQTSIYKAIRAGRLKVTKVGRRTLVNAESLRILVGGEA
jgi:excisionase family DNA binding protein